MPAPSANPFALLEISNDVPLPADDRFALAGHRWNKNKNEIDALTFAVAAGRPLLVRGEAGCGKSQLARAAAAVSKSKLFCEVIHPRFEALDLLYRYDVVERLADAQVNKIDETNSRYIKRGALWDAMDTVSATGTLPVLLIDEIDKADSDIPNALLEVLGNRSFRVPQLKDTTIRSTGGRMPLVIITTNEERELPAAFVRRCAVLNLNPPSEGVPFRDWLVERGKVHAHLTVDDDARTAAADQVLADRIASRDSGYPTVGLAEYIDLLHALDALADGTAVRVRGKTQLDWLERLGRYALVKHPDQDQERKSVRKQVESGDATLCCHRATPIAPRLKRVAARSVALTSFGFSFCQTPAPRP